MSICGRVNWKYNSIYLFLFAFVISFRNAGPSKGLRSSKAHSNSSETLYKGSTEGFIMQVKKARQTSCMLHSCRILADQVRNMPNEHERLTNLRNNLVH